MTHSEATASQPNPENPLDDFAIGLIRKTALRLSRQRGFTRDEAADLRQELTLFVLQRLQHYQPSRGHLYAYLTTIVDRHAAKLCVQRRAEHCTFLRQGASLNHPVEHEGELMSFGDTLANDIHQRRTGQAPRTPLEASELRQDVQQFISQLPEPFATLAKRLQHESPSQIAASTGGSNSGLHRQMRWLRKRLKNAGLKNYF